MGILTFIKAIPMMAKTAKFWVILTVISSLLAGVAWFVNDYRDTLKELAVAEERVSDLSGKITTVNTKIQAEKAKTQKLRETNSKISSQYLSKVRELQDLRQNYEMLRNEPDKAAKKIEASFNNYMNDISCITGDSDQCPK